MATALESRPASLRDSAVIQKLQQLRQPDNTTNLWYIARTYLLLLFAIGGAIYFYTHRSDWGISWLWNIPVSAVAVVLIGMGQHQLSVLTHEASHHVLFKNRLLNEIVSDFFCVFPMFSTTHHYRIQHVAHHQFVNDPQLDPNLPQLQVNGHWTHFPMSRKAFWRELVQQFWPINLLRYIKAQAASNSMGGTQGNPYYKPMKSPAGNRFLRIAGVAYLFGLTYGLSAFAFFGKAEWIWPTASVAMAAMLTMFATVPDDWFIHTRIRPTYPIRYQCLLRTLFFTAFAVGTAWAVKTYGWRAFLVISVLWVVPIFTSFSFFMMMRQMVQHANGGRGELSNTRVFLVNWLFRDSILPYGQDYHLPHHMFATVPHYRLKELHEFLLDYPEYRSEAVVVNGVVVGKNHDYPSVIDVLGPDWDRRNGSAHVDNSILESEDVDDRDILEGVAAASVSRGSSR